MSQAHNNSDGSGDRSPEKSQNKIETKAENKERSEASKQIADGELNKDISTQILEKRLSRKSGATGYGVASADSLLPTDAEIQKLGKQLTARKEQEKPIAIIAQNIGDNNPLNPQPQVMTDASAAAEDRKPLHDGSGAKVQVGNKEYNADKVTAQDWGAMLKKGLERVGQAAQNPELREGENPPEGGDKTFPHRGREDEFIDYSACAKANKTFPELAKYIGDGPGKIDPDLIAANMRNEQFHYVNVKDTGPDHYIKAHGNWPFNQNESIGPAQMQVRNIEHLAEQFPKILGTKADAVKSAETVERAPYFVAAYFADVINGIETKQKPDYISNSTWTSVNDHWQKGERNEALILAYNPHKDQVNHVFTQLDNIKASDWD